MQHDLSVLTKESGQAAKTEAPSPSVKERHYGIELLRILATFYIILLHVVGQGGVAAACGNGKGTYLSAYLLLALAYPAVNCYALISGFVGCQSRFKLSRLLGLWLTVVAVNIGVWGAFRLFAPTLAASYSLASCFTPLTNNEYWYVTAYFGLSVLTPVLNGVVHLPRKTFREMLVGLSVLYVLLPAYADNDLFLLRSGYSALWLILLYLAGAYFRLHVQPKTKKGALVGLAAYVCLSAFLPLQKHFVERSGEIGFLKNYAYTSVYVVLSSLALFAVFMRINIKNAAARKVISFFSAAAFGVYILHTQPLIWNNLLQGAFSSFAGYSAPQMVGLCLAAAFAIFLVCTVCEKIRALLFRLLGIDRLTVFLPTVIQKALQKIPGNG